MNSLIQDRVWTCRKSCKKELWNCANSLFLNNILSLEFWSLFNLSNQTPNWVVWIHHMQANWRVLFLVLYADCLLHILTIPKAPSLGRDFTNNNIYWGQRLLSLRLLKLYVITKYCKTSCQLQVLQCPDQCCHLIFSDGKVMLDSVCSLWNFHHFPPVTELVTETQAEA
jgi:hypothetical protein